MLRHGSLNLCGIRCESISLVTHDTDIDSACTTVIQYWMRALWVGSMPRNPSAIRTFCLQAPIDRGSTFHRIWLLGQEFNHSIICHISPMSFNACGMKCNQHDRANNETSVETVCHTVTSAVPISACGTREAKSGASKAYGSRVQFSHLQCLVRPGVTWRCQNPIPWDVEMLKNYTLGMKNKKYHEAWKCEDLIFWGRKTGLSHFLRPENTNSALWGLEMRKLNTPRPAITKILDPQARECEIPIPCTLPKLTSIMLPWSQ